jgi:septum formation protein
MADSSLILASSSPRRAEILRTLGIPFEIDQADVDEALVEGESAEVSAGRLADAKAAEVARRHPGRWILAADTLVSCRGAILGKPRDEVPGSGLVEQSRVGIAPLSEKEIDWYVATGEPRDKAGAYAVQGLGSRFIETVEGSFTNVMGLPARAVYLLMKDAGDSALALLALSSP